MAKGQQFCLFSDYWIVWSLPFQAVANGFLIVVIFQGGRGMSEGVGNDLDRFFMDVNYFIHVDGWKLTQTGTEIKKQIHEPQQNKHHGPAMI